MRHIVCQPNCATKPATTTTVSPAAGADTSREEARQDSTRDRADQPGDNRRPGCERDTQRKRERDEKDNERCRKIPAEVDVHGLEKRRGLVVDRGNAKSVESRTASVAKRRLGCVHTPTSGESLNSFFGNAPLHT
jgi:hypothetical protein